MIRKITSVLILALLPSLCFAQRGSHSDLYGTGVHQFFRGQYQDAIDSFSQAIVTSPQDARSYFYRGLCKECQWGTSTGGDDFRLGAYFESHKNGQASSIVNRSLERIQGCRRLEIEKYRREARKSYEIVKNLPPPKAQPIMYGEMIDVNSLGPIIQNVIPIQSVPPQQLSQPGEGIIDFDTTPLDSREVIPTDATPMPEEDVEAEGDEFEPEDPDDNDPFSTAQMDK